MAQTTQPVVIPLWPGGAPGFEERRNEPEIAQDWWVRNVHNPSLTVFAPPPDKATGVAVIIAPGGGYRELVFVGEGRQAGEFLSSIGVTAFALKYRLPHAEGSPYTMEHVRQDAYRAMRLVRSRAAEWHVDPARVGILGFSAGGHLASLIAYGKGDGDPAAADPVDRLNGKPDFQMLVYPGGGDSLPDPIPSDAPPTLLIVTNDDEYGCDDVSFELLRRYREAGRPIEAHFYARGLHAFNMGDRSRLITIRSWPQRMADWLNDTIIAPPQAP